MKRWLFFFIVIALGIGTVFFLKGFFGSQKGDIPLNALREDYKTDYVLMIAPLGDFPANTVVIEQTSALLATDSKLGHQVCDFATHISGEGIGMSSVLNCRLYRDPTHADDTYGADAVALSADFHIEKDRRGSLKEWHQL